MDLDELRRQIRSLVTLEDAPEPVLSLFCDLRGGPEAARERSSSRLAALRAGLAPQERPVFDEASGRALALLDATPVGSRGFAAWVRAGSAPFEKSLPFRVPLPHALSWQTQPSVFPIVDLKDTYHRYVVFHASADVARVLEVNVGEVTEAVLRERPESAVPRLSRTNGRKVWQARLRAETTVFLREGIALVDRVVSGRGHSHLVLAGPQAVTARVRELLPRHLAVKLFEVIDLGRHEPTTALLDAALEAFVEEEERESRRLAEQVALELRRGGLAASGPDEVRRALAAGRADVVVTLRDWGTPSSKEELVRLAVAGGAHVEVVEESETLARLGGVGALLRYAGPDVAVAEAATARADAVRT